MLLAHGADVADARGETAAALLGRKRDPRLRRVAELLATKPSPKPSR